VFVALSADVIALSADVVNRRQTSRRHWCVAKSLLPRFPALYIALQLRLFSTYMDQIAQRLREETPSVARMNIVDRRS
jgi:hypothetical protein